MCNVKPKILYFLTSILKIFACIYINIHIVAYVDAIIWKNQPRKQRKKSTKPKWDLSIYIKVQQDIELTYFSIHKVQ